jgi:hypothetical protein
MPAVLVAMVHPYFMMITTAVYYNYWPSSAWWCRWSP